MKKTALYILGGVIVGFAILYFLDKASGKGSGFGGWLNGNKDNDPIPTPVQPKNYKTAKMTANLYKGQEANFANEIELLQRFINVYDGAGTVPVTGIFDNATESAINRITGKTSTTLSYFRSMYLNKAGLNQLAEKIVRGEA